uniref:Uncharacterized protein n=1 Tax=Parascaris equorum TaxID=6256 RepID=A0A914RH57_PAREQ
MTVIRKNLPTLDPSAGVLTQDMIKTSESLAEARILNKIICYQFSMIAGVRIREIVTTPELLNEHQTNFSRWFLVSNDHEEHLKWCPCEELFVKLRLTLTAVMAAVFPSALQKLSDKFGEMIHLRSKRCFGTLRYTTPPVHYDRQLALIFYFLALSSTNRFPVTMSMLEDDIEGRLLCGTSPARNVKVKLWDEDDGNALLGKFLHSTSTALI